MKMGKVPILDTINKVPGGLMVIPLILGVLANTFFPDALQIGSFTTALFKSGANCLIGLLFFCSGAQIQFKSAGMSLYKGVVINLGKVLTGVACGVILAKVAGPEAAFLGVTPLAMIGAMSNSNGGLYTALASKYGDDTDVGAVAIISSNDGPFFEMMFMGIAGVAAIPIESLIACIVPIVVGMILGNLDGEFRTLLSNGLNMVLPVNGFVFGANMSLFTIINAGVPGLIMGLLCVFFTGVCVYWVYSIIRKKPDPMGMAVGTVAGNAVATPAAVAMADTSLQPYVEAATAQTAAAMVITALLTPVMTGFFAKRAAKKLAKKEAEAK